MLPVPPPDLRRLRRCRRALDVLLIALLALRAGMQGGPSGLPPPLPPPLTVDLARDGLDRLRLLPGVGPVRARAILEDRRRRGPVSGVEDLARVPGIGPTTVDRLRRTTLVRVLVDGRAVAPGAAATPDDR